MKNKILLYLFNKKNNSKLFSDNKTNFSNKLKTSLLNLSLLAAFLFININYTHAKDNVYDANNQFYADRITFKINVESDLFDEWKYSNRNTLPKTFLFLEKLYPNSKIKIAPFIDDKLIKATNKRYFELIPQFIKDSKKNNKPQNNNLKNAETLNNDSNNEIDKKIDNLFAIGQIKFDNKIDNNELLNLIEILKLVDGIEFVELEYKNYIFVTPNDSLFDQQYYLKSVNAIESWDLADESKPAIVAIVDTGVLTTHEDLMSNIYINTNEFGLDDNGQLKSTNGIDDDNNGYIDDYKGWDFASNSDVTGQDNNPDPGNVHGTHVAGIVGAVQNNTVGIAGVAKYVKLLAVKCGVDDPNANYIAAGYQGILYSAAMGAYTINCSWGGSGLGTAENEILKTANELGSIIVAAAGNNGSDLAFMPASSQYCVSVASSNSEDLKSGFSNFNIAVDITAPGSQIMSTVLDNQYASFNGTSMASPVIAAAIGVMKANNYNFTNKQLISFVRANSDNIDTLNTFFAGKLGSGRLNLRKALNKDVNKFAQLINQTVYYPNIDNILVGGDIVEIDYEIENILTDCQNVSIKVSLFNDKNDSSKVVIGEMKSGDIYKNDLINRIKYQIPENLPLNTEILLSFEIYENEEKIGISFIKLIVNPSYRTMNYNNISATFNHIGHIGYNDFPQNLQGQGLNFRQGSNLLFEGALMVADTNRKILKNIARTSGAGGQNREFFSEIPFKKSQKIGFVLGEAKFKDYRNDLPSLDTIDLDLDVHQSVYQYTTPNDSNYIIIKYDLTNNYSEKTENLFFGYYFDWDIGLSGKDNICYWDKINNIGIQYNSTDSNLTKIAVASLDDLPNNFYAIDNDGTSEDNIGVYDGFSREEKTKVISNGILRETSNSKDASMVIGVGPLSIDANETKTIHFVIACAETIENLPLEVQNAKNKLNSGTLSINQGNNKDFLNNQSFLVYPNPANNFIELKKNPQSSVSNLEANKLNNIEIYNLNGELLIKTEFSFNDLDTNNNLANQSIDNKINIEKLQNGIYLILLKKDNDLIQFDKLVIQK